jgi:hypothetical protein
LCSRIGGIEYVMSSDGHSIWYAGFHISQNRAAQMVEVNHRFRTSKKRRGLIFSLMATCRHARSNAYQLRANPHERKIHPAFECCAFRFGEAPVPLTLVRRISMKPQ